jgi:hypothetical protein
MDSVGSVRYADEQPSSGNTAALLTIRTADPTDGARRVNCGKVGHLLAEVKVATSKAPEAA